VNRGHAFATSVGVVLLAIFGSLTFLYNVPQGPLRVKADPILSSMDPWLAQNWSFFAPDPPSADIGMLVRFSSFDQIDETRSFVDVTSGGLESTKETLVPPREYRILTSALDLFLSAEDSLVSFHPDAANFEGRLTDRDRLVDDMLDRSSTPAETKRRYVGARQLLIRAARHFYEKLSPHPPGTGDAIQLRLVTYAYPRFEQRRLSATNEFEFRTFPWWRAT
jgi:hypothetical protein